MSGTRCQISGAWSQHEVVIVNIKRATLVGIVGVVVSMVSGALLYLLPVIQGDLGAEFPALYRLAQWISVVSFLSLHIGLLVFLNALYRRQ